MIKTLHEAKRGCGYRKPGGIYLRSDGIGRACGKLPVELTVCPCCSQGIKPARGFAWISGLVFKGDCPTDVSDCIYCPLRQIPERVGLLWVGGKFYPTPEVFLAEARSMGVSKRIAQIPKDLEIGKTWVALAHREVPFEDGTKRPAIFQVFKPSRIEYVVKGDETPEEIERLEKRGLELVNVIPS